jgi:hypothetical protein
MKIFNFKIILISFFSSIVILGFSLLAIEKKFPTLPCYQWEKSIPTGYFSFERVSFALWSSLCTNQNLFISASEGTGSPLFSEIMKGNYNLNFLEIKGAHRGIKTAAFFATHQIHPDRKKNLKVIILFNPVYWASFGSKTDDAAVYRSSLSTFSFKNRLNIKTSKMRELPIETPFIAMKHFFDELESWRSVFSMKKLEATPSQHQLPDNYDLSKNMLASHYSKESNGAFEWEFYHEVEPTQSFLQTLIHQFEIQKIKYCVVRLPLNEIFLESGRGDIPALKERIGQHFKNLDPIHTINTEYLGKEKYLFQDTMHFSPYGKLKLTEVIIGSTCFKDLEITP